MSDAALVALAQGGQLAALATLFERHRASLYVTALGMLRDRYEAADAVQDTFVTALMRISSVRDAAAVRGWLRAVVRNSCLMRLRQRRPMPIGELPDDADIDDGPEWHLEHSATREAIWSGLSALGEDERLTLMLRHFSRCTSYDSIAAVTAVPVGTVRSRLHRAHQRLAGELRRHAGGPSDCQLRLESQRRAEWEGFYDVVLHAPERRTYRQLFHDDVLIEEWGVTTRGIDDWVALERPAIELGVTAQVVDVVASYDVTIVEIDFLNPPETPDHCPPHGTFVHRLTEQRTSRLAIHYT